MNIKFSHKYHKLLVTGSTNEYHTGAYLLEVIIVNLEDLSNSFLQYDTDNGLFELPKKGKFMMLMFNKESTHDFFTTLRRWTPEKEKYYRAGIGKLFTIGFKPE